MNTKTENRAEEQARAQVSSIVEMVQALDVDYERLEELREERANHCADVGNLVSAEIHRIAWAQENPEDAAELTDLESAAGDCTSEDDARKRIQDDALSVEVRSGWTNPAALGEIGHEEFRIVLCVGGPHVEIVGTLAYGEPDHVRVLYRDWGTSGELFDFDRGAVLTYARQFYFGE